MLTAKTVMSVRSFA